MRNLDDEVQMRPKQRAVEDGMIAAICIARGTTPATRNTGDLSGLGLDLVDPWSSSS